MPQPRQIGYNPRELAEVLIRDQNIHEGYWFVSMVFNSSGGNFGLNGPATPGIVVTIPEIGICRSETPTDLTVDASVVNPLPTTNNIQ